jgi:Putative membrane protein insertion efficiency factor
MTHERKRRRLQDGIFALSISLGTVHAHADSTPTPTPAPASQDRTKTQREAGTHEVLDGWDAWESEDLAGEQALHGAHSEAEQTRASQEHLPSLAFGPLNALMLAAIRYYQIEIGPGSISRCPYLISCSAFAYHSIANAGFFGIPAVVDRLFYRENPDTFTKYPRTILPSGVVRYDDAAFRLP